MHLTLESFKNDIDLLKILTNIYSKLLSQLKDNPYKEISFNNWKIVNDLIFNDNITSNLILRNDNLNYDLNIEYKCLDELTENDQKFIINSIVLYTNNGKSEDIIDLKNKYIYSIVIDILTILEKNKNLL